MKYVLPLLIGTCVSAAAYFGVGYALTRPASQAVGAAPASLRSEAVGIAVPDGGMVSGWLAPGARGGGAVLLLHGVRSNRLQMLPRAEFLGRAGYSVLLIDLPSHGESTASRMTFGAKESSAVVASLNFLRERLPGERLAVIGMSLGAASTVLAKDRPALGAVVLESMYPTIQEAVSDRVEARLGAVGAAIAPILLWQLPLQTGVTMEDLQPVRHVGGLRAPVLIASGSEDLHTKWGETERIFGAAAEPKELWRVQGAAHVDLHAFGPQAYEARILRFLGRHLRAEP